MLTDAQIDRATSAALRPRDRDVFRLLFVGRLSSAKNVDVLLRAISLFKNGKRKIECNIVGEGPERVALQEQAALLGIESHVNFIGGIGFDEVLDHYEKAEALVLASDVEGWPKAIAEGMAFGLVCIGTERGMMPQMLGEGRGFLVPPRNPEALASALQQIADYPSESRTMAIRAAAWAQNYSIDGLREALRNLMEEQWDLSFATSKFAPKNDRIASGAVATATHNALD
jgi:glycosyltransferase involved in cell wall biosynthesis